MFEAVESLVSEHAELEERMADPAVHSDPGLAKKLGQRYAELSAIVKTYRDFQQVTDDLEVARRTRERGLAVGPGRHYVVAEDDAAHLRLCYAAITEQQIPTAVKILAESL